MCNWPAVTARQTHRPCATRLQRGASDLLSTSNSLNIARDVNAACASFGQERFDASGVLSGADREQFLIRGGPGAGATAMSAAVSSAVSIFAQGKPVRSRRFA